MAAEKDEPKVHISLAPHRWADVERLAAKYTKGDTDWLVDQAIELVSYLDREDEENLELLLNDLLEYGAEGLVGVRKLLDRAGEAKQAREREAGSGTQS
jgi:hypothetical protein